MTITRTKERIKQTGESTIATLYVVHNSINDLKYYGIVWRLNKTPNDRLQDHIQGKGGVHLYQAMQQHGVDKFYVQSLCVGSLSYIRDLEIQMIRSYSSVYEGSGYNGCMSRAIVLSQDGYDRMVAKSYGNNNGRGNKGRSKTNCSGVRRQARKLSEYSGDNRTRAQKEWDKQKSSSILADIADGSRKSPPTQPIGNTVVYNPTTMQRRHVSKEEATMLMNSGEWLYGRGKIKPKGRRLVGPDGTEYINLKAAMAATGINDHVLRRRCNMKVRNTHGWRWK